MRGRLLNALKSKRREKIPFAPQLCLQQNVEKKRHRLVACENLMCYFDVRVYHARSNIVNVYLHVTMYVKNLKFQKKITIYIFIRLKVIFLQLNCNYNILTLKRKMYETVGTKE